MTNVNQRVSLMDDYDAKIQELNKELDREKKLRFCADAAVS